MNVFKKTSRLLNKSDYDQVFAKASKLTTPEFVILYRQNQLRHARLGLVISKRKIARAHERNRVKRQIREYFRQNDLPSLDLIFLAKKDISATSNKTIRENLNKIWPRLKKS